MFGSEFSHSTTFPDGAIFVVQLHPSIQINLKFIECAVDLLSKRGPIKLIEYRLVKTFTDAIGLRTFSLGPPVIDIFHRQV